MIISGKKWICLSMLLIGLFSAESKDVPSPLIAEGKIQRISRLADPKKSDYPDCYFMAEFKIHSVISGKIPDVVVNLAIPGFINYQYTEYIKLKQDDLLRVEIINETNASEKEKSTQNCDDLNMFENSIYYLRRAEVISTFSESAEKVVAQREKYISKWGMPLNEKQTEKAIRERSIAIREDLANIRKQTQESSISRQEIQKLFKNRTNNLPIFKECAFWFQNGTGVFAVPLHADKYSWDQPLSRAAVQDNLPAIVALDRFLKSKNVDLIIVLYPGWPDLGIRALIPETQSIPIRQNLEITKFLLEHDVEVVDLAPEMIQMIPRSEFLLYYYHLNRHPGWETQDLAGRLTAQRLARYDLPKNLNPELFRESRTNARYSKDYVYPSGLPIAGNTPGKPVMTNVTFYDKEWTKSNDDSRVLTWGNSFLEWPKNWAFVTALAKYTQQFSTIRHGAGCFTTMVRQLLLKPESFLTNKKVMIVPVAVSMIEAFKFWNIQTLDKSLSITSEVIRTIPVALPEPQSSAKCSDVQKLANDNKVKGRTYYIVKDQPLEIKLPKIKRRADCQYLVDVQFYNQRMVTIQVGNNSRTPCYNALFILDSVRLPYETADESIKISPYGVREGVIFIARIEILEIPNKGTLK